MNDKTTEADGQKYSIETIKKAYWKEFHEAGDVWFDCLGSPEENNESTARCWLDFLEALKQCDKENRSDHR